MAKIILFICFLPVALFEIFFYKQFGLVVVGTLYLVLSLQADRAAKKFLMDGLRWPVETRQSRLRKGRESEEGEELFVLPLGEKKAKPTYTPPRSNPCPPPVEPVRLTRPSPVRISQTQLEVAEVYAKPNFAEPNFSGRAHEVLAVPEHAATRTIKRAFRFWVKQMHPDHNGALPQEVANRRVQRISEAKELLLQRRRRKKAA